MRPEQLQSVVGCGQIELLSWLAALDDFRNWLSLGLRPAKGDENRARGQNSGAGSGEIESASGAIEAEQLFDPERA